MSEPADWFRIEADYRAGVLSLRAIAGEHGISEGAIRKRAKKDGWQRDLGAKIRAKAEALVREEAVREEVRAAHCVPEREIIEANAELQANLIRTHRKDITRYRELCLRLLAELEAQTAEPELFRQIGELLACPDEKGQDRLNEAYHKAISLPQRIKGAKDLADTLKTLVGLERQAFGVADNAEGDKPDDGPLSERILQARRRAAG